MPGLTSLPLGFPSTAHGLGKYLSASLLKLGPRMLGNASVCYTAWLTEPRDKGLNSVASYGHKAKAGARWSRLQGERSRMQDLPCVHHELLEVGVGSSSPTVFSGSCNLISQGCQPHHFSSNDNGSGEHHLTSELQCRLGQIATRGHIRRTASRTA